MLSEWLMGLLNRLAVCLRNSRAREKARESVLEHGLPGLRRRSYAFTQASFAAGTGCTIDFAGDLPRGRWIELRYESNVHAPLVRPVLRIDMAEGPVEKVLPAPLFGTGQWIGFVPDEATALSVIAEGAGPAGCPQMVSVSGIPWLLVIVLAYLGSDILRAYYGVGLLCTGKRLRGCNELESAIAPTPISFYDRWRHRRERPRRAELDIPRGTGPGVPRIEFVCQWIPSAGMAPFLKTYHSLAAQWPADWRLLLLTPDGEPPRCLRAQDASRDSRIVFISAGTLVRDALRDDPAVHRVVTPLRLGDRAAPWSAALVADAFAVHPDDGLLYGDEDVCDDDGRHHDPELKPDWSPIFQQGSDYLGRCVFARTSRLPSSLTCADLLIPAGLVAAQGGAAGRVVHLRRILLSRASLPTEAGREKPSNTARRYFPPMPSITVIIPNKDQPEMLDQCIRSLKPCSVPFELIIIDNGSTDARIEPLYELLRTQHAARVIQAPGPFNFSALCNRAAAAAAGKVLVFLNNDIVALSSAWLPALLGWVARDDVGAVGAKLLYPAGTIQHAGIVLGIEGYAGHIEHGVPGAFGGYLGRLAHAREVAAVTGACIAVEKRKFEAVGGFDEKEFPVDLGDVDLCLRLAQRGWKTVFEPASMLTHYESATRGKQVSAAQRYAFERRNFYARWGKQLRDDPFHHPALSLHSQMTMLD